MSLQDLFIATVLFFSFMIVLWKSKKVLLAVVFLEMLVMLIILTTFNLGNDLEMMALFVFFVSESLIMLVTLYSSVRLVGKIRSQMVLL